MRNFGSVSKPRKVQQCVYCISIDSKNVWIPAFIEQCSKDCNMSMCRSSVFLVQINPHVSDLENREAGFSSSHHQIPNFINLYRHLKCPIDILNSIVPVLKARCLLGGENLKMAFHIIIEILCYLSLSYYLRNSLHHIYRVLFSTVPPYFQYQNEKKLAQPMRSFFTLNFFLKKQLWLASTGFSFWC